MRFYFNNSAARESFEELITNDSDLVLIDQTVYHTDDVFHCEHCGEAFPMDDAIHTENGEIYCSSDCAESAGYAMIESGEWYPEDETRYVESHGILVHEDDAYGCEACGEYALSDDAICTDSGVYCSRECAPNCGISSYHSGSRHVARATDGEHRIGFEIEKEDWAVRERIENRDIEFPEHWVVEEDGSLGEGGFEVITQAYNLSKEYERILKDFESVAGVLNAECSSACGGHITVSTVGKTGERFCKDNTQLLAFFMMLFPKRLRNSYVRSGRLSQLIASSDKYRPFKIMSDRVEFRIPSKVSSRDALKRRVNVIQWFLSERPTVDDVCKSGLLRAVYSDVYTDAEWNDRLDMFRDFHTWFVGDASPSDRIAQYLTLGVY